MNKLPRLLPQRYELLVALALFALGLVSTGVALNFLCRLVLVGWRAADFLFNLF